ncbi:MAG: hypothetical protein ACLQPH_22050 [Acidimicrobiales bacterium]
MQKRARQPVLWVPTTAPARAPNVAPEQRAIVSLTAAQNGTYVCAREGNSLVTSNPRF